MAVGDAAMYGALAGSSPARPDARCAAPEGAAVPADQRGAVRGGGPRHRARPSTASPAAGGWSCRSRPSLRALVYLLMIFHVDDLLLYPLVFVALVMQKTYAVSKCALVPLVVRSDEELVEANSKLGLISGVVGALAIGPLALLGKASTHACRCSSASCCSCAPACRPRRLPRDVGRRCAGRAGREGRAAFRAAFVLARRRR